MAGPAIHFRLTPGALASLAAVSARLTGDEKAAAEARVGTCLVCGDFWLADPECECSCLREGVPPDAISDEEFEAARADVIRRYGKIPPSLQRVVDRGGRFGMAAVKAARP